MGLFDLFKGNGKKDKGEKAEKPKPNAAARFAERAGDKRAQNFDRQEAIAALAEMGTADAVAALGSAIVRGSAISCPSRDRGR